MYTKSSAPATSKLLNEIPREDAVNSLAYEAEARLKDPVYGCVGAISVLQRQVLNLQKELDATNADLMRYVGNDHNPYHHDPSHLSMNLIINNDQIQQRSGNYGHGLGESGFGSVLSTRLQGFLHILLAHEYWASRDQGPDAGGR
ncbi:UNVERIFIED_CONTAM: LOB domain-containing protein 25 [Sesamum angustifolium]|uniref:LOB domain-containing protein 25 n=1 Tax=Sesamum angustifolium TaxID=2727405 RepID=A0AAW2NKM3_9LAMI